ncbi:MAG TPA: glycosyltransferase, partial [Flavisolibacter sp.]|nr:glycosyltransferase [Flavisolibacter sp.]
MISVIIPTYNEQEHIAETIRWLWLHDEAGFISEIIISDGGSTDKTVAVALSEGVRAAVSPRKGRAVQMNYGASIATQSILYFLHADTIPPPTFTIDIK